VWLAAKVALFVQMEGSARSRMRIVFGCFAFSFFRSDEDFSLRPANILQ
jgi:hypothetical protein